MVRIDGTAERIDPFDFYLPCPAPAEQVALGAKRWTGNEKYIVTVMPNEIQAIEQRVFLRATDDHARDDMSDSHLEILIKVGVDIIHDFLDPIRAIPMTVTRVGVYDQAIGYTKRVHFFA